VLGKIGLLLQTATATAPSSSTFRLSAEKSPDRRWKTPCSAQYEEAGTDGEPGVKRRGCTPLPGGMCDRVLLDDFISAEEVASLRMIAEKGMARSGAASRLGPTIMDVNSGWVLPAGAYQPVSIYNNGPLYSSAEYDLYRDVTQRLKRMLEHVFELDAGSDDAGVFFTAPTFITREAEGVVAGTGAAWQPSTMHDEYWHPHVDKNNTAHYDYSGLVYLSTQGEDFDGGELEFYDHGHLDCSAFVDPVAPGPCVPVGPPSLVVAPRAGRAVVFGSGRENPHRVRRVSAGTRYVLSFWFTCDARLEMKSFLDGKMHVRFGETASEL